MAQQPSTAVKRLPPLLCFLTTRQRAKGTVFEHCLQALQPSHKDTGSSGLKSAAAKLTLPLLPFSKGNAPATKEKKSNTDTDVCCIYNNVPLFIFQKHMVKENQSHVSVAFLVSTALSLNPVVICQVMSMLEREKIPLLGDAELFPCFSLHYIQCIYGNAVSKQ